MNDEPTIIDTDHEPSMAVALRNEPEPALPATAQVHRVNEVAEALLPAYQKASTLELTEAEKAALTAPFDDKDVEVRPHDGLLYIPHIVISDRLCQVFGPGKWCTVRRREWLEGNRVYAEWVLLIRGVFVGESVGAMDYHPGNPKMNYSDALEGTRGECIRRIAGKELGCGSQVWRPSYCREWSAKNACQVRGKWERRLTDYTPSKVETTPRDEQPIKAAPKAKEGAKTTPIEPDKLRKRFIEVLGDQKGKFVDLAIKAGWLLPTEGIEDLDEKYLPRDKAALDKLMEDLKNIDVPTP